MIIPILFFCSGATALIYEVIWAKYLSLMFGSIPLLAAWLQQSSTDSGRRSARFYSINSLGAVCGAGLAGFVLVLQLGLVAALQATALLNVLIGVVAVAFARRSTGSSES